MAEYRQYPMRKLLNADRLVTLLLAELMPAFGCFREVSITTLELAAGVVVDEFGDLCIKEIGLAYRLYAGHKYPEGEVTPMYNGAFSIPHITSVLQAYRRHRRRFDNACREIEKERKRKDNTEAWVNAWEEQAPTLFPQWLEEAREIYQLTGEEHINEKSVPIDWYDLAKKYCGFDPKTICQVPGEATTIWETVLEEVQQERRTEAFAARKRREEGRADKLDQLIREVAVDAGVKARFQKRLFFVKMIQQATVIPTRCHISNKEDHQKNDRLWLGLAKQ